MNNDELSETLKLMFDLAEARRIAKMFFKTFAEMPCSVDEIFPEFEFLPEDHWLINELI